MTTSFFLSSHKDHCWMALGLLAAVAESIGDPAATILVGKIFKDLQGLISKQLSPAALLYNVRIYSICLVGIAAYTFSMNWLGYTIWLSVGYRQGHYARRRLYRSFVMRSAAWFDNQKQASGIAVTYFKDIQDMELAAGIITYELLVMFVGFCVQIGVAFYYSWAVTLVCLAGIPVLIVIGSLFSPTITHKILAAKSILDIAGERVTWVLQALQTVKIFQRELYEWSFVHRQLLHYQKSTISYWVVFKIHEGLCRTIVLMIFVQGYYFGTYMVNHHGLNAGDIITVFFSCLSASGLLQQLVTHLIDWNRGTASADRLLKALNYDETEILHNSIGLMPSREGSVSKPFEKLGWVTIARTLSSETESSRKRSTDIPLESISCFDSAFALNPSSTFERYDGVSHNSTRENDLAGHVVFSDVVFSYPSRQEIVLAGLSLEFAPGSLTFVLGTSGSGKSSIANLISKQYPWQAGEVAIDGHGVNLLSKNWIENNVYVVEQVPKLFDVSILENIKVGSQTPELVTNKQVEKVLEITCADFVWDLPNQLDTSGDYVLSGGQMQRISLARAFISDAPIMVLDEATNALDPQLQIQVMRRIMTYRQNKTTIVITHDPSIIPNHCPVYVLHDGIAQRFASITAAMPHIELQPFSRIERNAHISKQSRSIALDTEPIVDFKLSSGSRVIPAKASMNTTLELFKYMPSKPLYFMGLGVTIVHAAINPIFSFVFSKLIMGILDTQKTQVTLWAILVTMCAVLDGVATVFTVVLNISGQQWLRSIREHLFNQLLYRQGMQLSREESTYYSKLLISDSEKCAEILTLYWPGLLNMLVLGLVGILWSTVTGWKLTLVGISLLPAFVIVNQWYKWLSTRWNSERESRRTNLMRLFSDLMTPSGFRTLKMQHLERYFETFYNERESSLHALTTKMVFQVGFGYGILKSFPYMLESLILWYGMYLIAHDEYSSQSTMTVFSLIMFTIVTIDQLTTNISFVGTGFEAMTRLLDALNEHSDEHVKIRSYCSSIEGKSPVWSQISFHHVEVRLPSGRLILAPFSATLQRGDTIAIVGPSGSGKSTIARMLLKLQRPSKGEIIVDRQWDLESLSDSEVRKHIALVGQMPLDFFDGTIEDNLLYALDPNYITGPAEMIDVCKRCGVHDFVMNLEDAYNTRIKSGLLSGGQMQRLGIARAVLRSPQVLVLDESTSALDQESKHTIMGLISDLKASHDMAIIIITHQMDVAATADRVIELNT